MNPFSGLMRSWFAICLAWRYRRALSGFLKKEPPRCTPTLLNVSPETWYAQGIRVLVLDFDGVLSFYQGDAPLAAINDWLNLAKQVFGDAIFVLSNLPTPARQTLFETQYPGIHLLPAKRKKPYPDGIQAILDKTGCTAKELLLVDDRLLTGIVLAVSLGARACWVTKPYQNFDLHPIKESFVMFLRWLDRCCIKAMLIF